MVRPGGSGKPEGLPYTRNIGRSRRRTKLGGIAALAAVAVLCAPIDAQIPTQVAAGTRPASKDGDDIFEPTKLHRVHVSISPAEWAVLQTSTANGGPVRGGSEYSLPDGRVVHVGSGFGGVFPWVRADMRVDGGDEFKDVGIRYKGNLSFRSTSAAVPLFANFKLKIKKEDALLFRSMLKKIATFSKPEKLWRVNNLFD